MADDAKNRDDAQKVVDVPKNDADKTKNVVIILIALSIIVMVFTPLVTIFAMRSFVTAQLPESSAPDMRASVKSGEVKIEKIQCNVAKTKGTRFISMDVVIQFSEPKDMEKFFQEKTPENPYGMLNRIKADVISIASDKQLEELDSKDNLKNLAEEIKESIKNMLPKDPKYAPGTVTDICFSSFLIN